MATCNDCIHYTVCHTLEIEDCVNFKNKSDYAEVKHGEWMPYETEETYGDDGTIWYKCSVCGTDALGRCYDDEWYSYPIQSDFCHKCGAKMDGRSDT